MSARGKKKKIGCCTNAKQNCIAFLKDLGKLIQANYIQHSRGLCSNENSNFFILSSRKKGVIIFTISFFFSHLYNSDPCLILPKVLPRLPPYNSLGSSDTGITVSLREAWLHFLSSSSCFLLKHFPSLTICSYQKTTNWKFLVFFTPPKNVIFLLHSLCCPEKQKTNM